MRALLVALALVLCADLVQAQQQPPPDTLTPQQRALQRLRTLRAPGAPDTATTQRDSVPPQEISVEGDSLQPGARRPAPPAQISRDDIMTRLLTLQNYVATEYQGDSAHYRTDIERLELRGSPQVAREGNQLVADSAIIFSQRQALACGYGNPVLHAVGQTEPLASDTVCFDVQRRLGRAFGATTRVQEGATWNVRCDAYFVGDQLYCHDAIFTDCDLPYPHQHYAFGAKELKAIRGNVIVARNVTLSFADVPVFWLPFMVQSLSRGRRSGILMPRFGINDIATTSSRYNRRIEDVGFYLAINDYMGAEVALDWYSANWTSLRGSFDYRWDRQFLNGGLTYRMYWPDGGGRQLTIASNNSWQPDERTRLGVNVNYASSSRFVRQNTFDPTELIRSINSSAALSRRFDWATLSLESRRQQQLSDGTVTWVRPSLGLSFTSQTLFEADPGQERWFSNITWGGSTNFKIDERDIDPANPSRSAQGERNIQASASHGFTIGKFSISQSANVTDRTLEGREVPGDTLGLGPLPEFSRQNGSWSTGINFSQRLIGTSTLTPGVSLGGQFVRSDSTGNVYVTSPTRVDLSSSLRLELYGFWPGVGPFERFRHRVSPTFTYNYSPAARADSVQQAVFRSDGIAERNQISIGFNQTFEAKYRSRTPQPAEIRDTTPSAARDTIPGDSAVQQPSRFGARDTLNGRVLTRRQQVETVSLLAINTSVLTYDFVRARDGDGLVNTQLSNSIQSDLLRGMQLSIVHDLFRPVPADTLLGTPAGRSFAPHLSRVNASFSLNANSWLFRVLRLGRPDTVSGNVREGVQADSIGAGPAVDRTETEYGLIGTSRRSAPGRPRGSAGDWNATFNYSLVRPRPGAGGEDNQMITANVTFQATENWSVRWNTGYSFTDSEFSQHVLTLTRTLHDWDANFDFVKAQNGNFSMQFRVHLRANPDVKLDYSQSDRQLPPTGF